MTGFFISFICTLVFTKDNSIFKSSMLVNLHVYRISLYLHIGLNLTHDVLRPDFRRNLYQAVSISLLGYAAFLKIRFGFTLYGCKILHLL